MKPIHLVLASGGAAAVLTISIGAYALGQHTGAQGGDAGPRVAVRGTAIPSPQASPTGSAEPTQKGTPSAQATSAASTTTSRTQSTHTVTVVPAPRPTAVPTQSQTSSNSQTSSSSTSSSTNTTSSTSTNTTPTCADRTLANDGGSSVGIWWTVDSHCSTVTASFHWIGYPGWSAFEILDTGNHVKWQGTVDSNSSADQTFSVSLSPGSYVLQNTGNGSYNGSGTAPEWAVTIAEAP